MSANTFMKLNANTLRYVGHNSDQNAFTDQTDLNLFWIKFNVFLKKKIYNFVTKVKPRPDNNQILISILTKYFHFQVPYEDYKTECKDGYDYKCEEQWVCLDYPKPASLKYCHNKKWQSTGDCKNLHVENCKDVKFTAYK